MTYFCSDESSVIVFAKNADKISMVCDLMNGSKYKTIAQNFLTQKNIELQCKYSYSVSDPATQKPAAHVFFATDKTQVGYYVKVSRATNNVSEWYINEDIMRSEESQVIWFSLDLTTNEKLEYYVLETIDSVMTEKKFNVATNEQLATNHFERFNDLTLEQQELIKDLPFKRTTVCWSNKSNGFTVEFLPVYKDVYDGINMANLSLLEIEMN
jgi:hypothetical protein